MMPAKASWWRDRQGSVAIEFAILGPTLLAMLLGVVQFGIGMQNYSALRSVSAEVARYAAINAQDAAAKSNMTLRDNNAQITQYARDVATSQPYNLNASNLTVTITSVPTRVAGASERSIELRYTIPSVLSIIGIGSIPISYTRPFFIA